MVSMKRVTELLLLLLGWLCREATGFSCQDVSGSSCSCIEESNYEILCPAQQNTGDSVLTLRLGRRQDAELLCNQPGTLYSEIQPLLSGLNIGEVQQLVIAYCPFPTNGSLADYLTLLNITNLHYFTFRNGYSEAGVAEEGFGPSSLTNLSELRHLGLENNNLKNLDRSYFDGLTSLTSLYLTGNNQLGRLDVDTFAGLTQLKELHLLACGLAELVPGLFDSLVNLEILQLFNNRLTELSPRLFSRLANLQSLNFGKNQLTSLPDGIFSGLANLEDVSLDKNNYATLPDRLFADNPKVKSLELILNGPLCPHTYPTCEQRVTRLTLQSETFAGSSLEAIKMLHVPMAGGSLPEGLFEGCGSLKNVTIQSGWIDSLPAGLFAPIQANIERIDFAGNRLASLPPGLFAGLRKLKSLRLLANRLTQINEADFSDLVSLEVLHLHENSIEVIAPKALANLAQLREIDVSQNRIVLTEERPESNFLSSQPFERLETLDLSHNQIAVLEENLRFTCLNLRLLNLSHNALTVVDMQEMQFVKNKDVRMSLDLSNNLIEWVSLESNSMLESILNQSYQYDLLLGGNPIRCDCYASELKQKLTEGLETIIGNMVNIISENDIFCGASSPPQLRNQLLTSVSYSSLVCPFPSEYMRVNCTNSCSCHLNRHYAEVTVNCSGLGMTRLPDYLPSGINWGRGEFGIRLHMENNAIEDLYTAVSSFYNRSEKNFRNIHYLYLSNNRLQAFHQETLPANLRHLTLDNNRIEVLHQTDINFFDELINRTNLQLRLGNNPYSCSCESQELFYFIKNRGKNVIDKNAVLLSCGDESLSVASSELGEFCTILPSPAIIAGVTILIFFLISFAVVMFIYVCYRDTIIIWVYSKSWARIFFPEDILDQDKPYDAFLSYSHHDSDFVNDVLLPGLESPENPDYKYRCLLHERDWHVGEMIPDQIIQSVKSSRRTIILLTKEYINSMWTKMEFRAAHSQALEDKTQRLILIVRGDLPPKEEMEEDLQKYIAMNTYLDTEDPWFWPKLRYSLPHRGGLWSKRTKTEKEIKKLEMLRAQAEIELERRKDPEVGSSPPNTTVPSSNNNRNNHAAVALTTISTGRLQPLPPIPSMGTANNSSPPTLASSNASSRKQLLTDDFLTEIMGPKQARSQVTEGGRLVRNILTEQKL